MLLSRHETKTPRRRSSDRAGLQTPHAATGASVMRFLAMPGACGITVSRSPIDGPRPFRVCMFGHGFDEIVAFGSSVDDAVARGLQAYEIACMRSPI